MEGDKELGRRSHRVQVRLRQPELPRHHRALVAARLRDVPRASLFLTAPHLLLHGAHSAPGVHRRRTPRRRGRRTRTRTSRPTRPRARPSPSPRATTSAPSPASPRARSCCRKRTRRRSTCTARFTKGSRCGRRRGRGAPSSPSPSAAATSTTKTAARPSVRACHSCRLHVRSRRHFSDRGRCLPVVQGTPARAGRTRSGGRTTTRSSSARNPCPATRASR